MTIKIYHNNKPYYQIDTFNNVSHLWTENQGENGKWLVILFKMKSEEYKKYKGGETWIEIDQETEINVY